MRLTTGQAGKLAHLAAGRSLPKSDLPAKLLKPLLAAGVVRLERSGASYRVRGAPGKLEAYAEREWGIHDLATLAEATPENRSRSLLADIAGDSKALPNRPFDGIFIRSFGQCYLGEELLTACPGGSALLITERELPRLRVESDLLIGIENPACLWEFEKAACRFPELEGRRYTLVLRWRWGPAWQRWLEAWKGEFLYFGDYDPAGLRIFASEVLPRQPRARLLIPSDLAELLEARGCRKLYLSQEAALRTVETSAASCDYSGIREIVALLKQTRKGLEQETLLTD